MKKKILLIMLLVFSLVIYTGCSKEEPQVNEDVVVELERIIAFSYFRSSEF